MGRQPLPVALALDDDLVAGVGEPVEGAVAEDGVVEETEPLVDSPVGGDDEAGGAMPGDDELVEVYGLLLGHPVETEVVDGECRELATPADALAEPLEPLPKPKAAATLAGGGVGSRAALAN